MYWEKLKDNKCIHVLTRLTQCWTFLVCGLFPFKPKLKREGLISPSTQVPLQASNTIIKRFFFSLFFSNYILDFLKIVIVLQRFSKSKCILRFPLEEKGNFFNLFNLIKSFIFSLQVFFSHCKKKELFPRGVDLMYVTP